MLIGDVGGKDALIVDDIWGTGTTILNAARKVKESGARRIIAAVTHGEFLQTETLDSLKELSESPIETVYVTDSIDHRDEVVEHPKIQVVSIAPLLAEAIKRTHTGQGLTELFE